MINITDTKTLRNNLFFNINLPGDTRKELTFFFNLNIAFIVSMYIPAVKIEIDHLLNYIIGILK